MEVTLPSLVHSKIKLAGIVLQVLDMNGAFTTPFNEAVFTEEEGLTYFDCTDLVRDVTRRTLNVLNSTTSVPETLDGIQFELLKLEGGIKPHFHQNSDSIVMVHKDSPHSWGDFKTLLPSSKNWAPIECEAVFYIPRLITHGFLRSANESKSPLQLLTAGFPAITVEDTHRIISLAPLT